MEKFSQWVFRIEKGVGGLLLLLMLSFVFFSTIGRYTGWYNMSWSDEASRYCMIWSVFLLAGLSAFRGQMFSIDVLSDKLPLKGQRVFVIIRFILMTAFRVFAVVYGVNMMKHQIRINQTSPSLKLPMWFMYSSVPIGCALLLAHYTALVWTQLKDINCKLKTEGGN